MFLSVKKCSLLFSMFLCTFWFWLLSVFDIDYDLCLFLNSVCLYLDPSYLITWIHSNTAHTQFAHLCLASLHAANYLLIWQLSFCSGMHYVYSWGNLKCHPCTHVSTIETYSWDRFHCRYDSICFQLLSQMFHILSAHCSIKYNEIMHTDKK